MGKVSQSAVSDAPPKYDDVNPAPPDYVKSKTATHSKQTEPQAVIATGSSKKWYQRKRVWTIVVFLLLAIIGLVVGLVIALVVNKHKSDTSSDSDNDSDNEQTTLCSGSICPQVITTATFNSRFHVFIRTADNRIAHNSAGSGKMLFEFRESWSDLGETTGSLISQPAAIAWELDDTPRLSIFAVSSSNNTVYGRYLVEETWSDWEEVGANAGSQPVLCRVGDGTTERIDMWVTDLDNHDVMQQSWNVTENSWSVDDGFMETNGTGPAKTAPAVVCRDDDITHDVVWYGREDGGALWHRGYNSTVSKWEEARGFGGNFLGDPTLFMHEKRPHRIDFFGVQSNHEVYHFNRIGDEYSELVSLGGNVTSTPSVVGSVSALTDTFDVVALGRDGDVRHKYYDGTSWSKWENIHLPSISAPTLAMFGKYRIVLLVLREDGVYYATGTGAAKNWIGTMNLNPIGGNPSFKYFVDSS